MVWLRLRLPVGVVVGAAVGLTVLEQLKERVGGTETDRLTVEIGVLVGVNEWFGEVGVSE